MGYCSTLILLTLEQADPFAKKDWYDIKAPSSPYLGYQGVEKERECNSTRVLVLILNLMSTQSIMQYCPA
ncbi:hypothetical protein E1A91_A11G210400v1 [Gossypium mustelinum]|uniref:Uncharacterized protein n=1 Tax=Gossypium mustelinum TaxID=34275 RepID=A0A5D2X9Q2_GOSMU|nr:hypothetical protein E1A91_A11G210400v1 [Gossypium mustelinum]